MKIKKKRSEAWNLSGLGRLTWLVVVRGLGGGGSGDYVAGIFPNVSSFPKCTEEHVSVIQT